MVRSHPLLVALAALALSAATAPAATVSGSLTPAYGAPLVVQTTQTTVDGLYGAIDQSSGSELDAGYAYAANDTLYLFLAGNLQFWLQLEGNITHIDPLFVFLDTQPGGQGTLLAGDPRVDAWFDLSALAGLKFDADFEPDWAFGLGSATWPTLRAYEAELAAGGGGAGTFLGNATCGGPGALSGGGNPFGVAVTLDDRNTGGVTQGCGASSGAGVNTGIEWAIPLAAIGNPTGCIRVCAFLEPFNTSSLLDQVLGPLPAGTCDPGPASGVDFSAIPGEQFFSVCPQATPARRVPWGRLKAAYR